MRIWDGRNRNRRRDTIADEQRGPAHYHGSPSTAAEAFALDLARPRDSTTLKVKHELCWAGEGEGSIFQRRWRGGRGMEEQPAIREQGFASPIRGASNGATRAEFFQGDGGLSSPFPHPQNGARECSITADQGELWSFGRQPWNRECASPMNFFTTIFPASGSAPNGNRNWERTSSTRRRADAPAPRPRFTDLPISRRERSGKISLGRRHGTRPAGQSRP